VAERPARYARAVVGVAFGACVLLEAPQAGAQSLAQNKMPDEDFASSMAVGAPQRHTRTLTPRLDATEQLRGQASGALHAPGVRSRHVQREEGGTAREQESSSRSELPED
jgi:hypothetical protein